MLHRAKCGPNFGFPSDNYIGSTLQQNTPSDSWVSFFRDRRLIPQMELTLDLLDDRTCCDLYNFYHLLNHLNLFGLPYLSNVSTIAKRYA